MTHGELVKDRIRSSSSHVKTKAVRACELATDNKLPSRKAAEDVHGAIFSCSDRRTGNR
jgi:hypothetical protein